MAALLTENPLLLLFLVAAIGTLIGRIQIFGSRLGVAAVLFVGLAFGAANPAFQIPDIVFQLGLILFVYTIGIANGPSFFRAFQQEGRQQIGFILFSLSIPLLIAFGVYVALDFSPHIIAGIFAGTANNTPALAAALDYIGNTLGALQGDMAIADAVVGYSICYPIGVIGRMAMIGLFERLWRIDYAAEAASLRDRYPVDQAITNRTIEVTKQTGVPIRQLRRQFGWEVVFGRILRGDDTYLISGETCFHEGDLIIVAGADAALDKIERDLGRRAAEDLFADQSLYAARRIFVTNPDIVGQTIASLDLREQFGAVVSRVRRGDIDLLAGNDTVLELGDRVRVYAQRSEIPKISALLGDSYNAISQINLLSLGIGITAGIALGSIPLPLPGGATFQLGFAGGPLLVALVLGAMRRTGSIVWTLPHSANQTLREIGLIFLLAGVGVRSGNALVTSFTGGNGLQIVLAGIFMILATMLLSLVVGHKLLNIPFTLVIGMISAQPAVLAYSIDRAQNQLPAIAYTVAFPISIIAKVAFVQLLLLFLQ